MRSQRNPQVDTTANYKHWKPQLVSNATILFGGAGAICLALALLSLFMQRQSMSYLHESFALLFSNMHLLTIVGISLIILAGASEAISRLRTPPPVWRVRQELIRALGDLGLLELNNTELWQGKFAVCPVGKWNRQARCFTVPFLLRNVNATEEKFASIEKSIAGFSRSLDCSIEQDNSKRLYNFKLTLWYTPNPYQRVENLNPFN